MSAFHKHNLKCTLQLLQGARGTCGNTYFSPNLMGFGEFYFLNKCMLGGNKDGSSYLNLMAPFSEDNLRISHLA